MQAHQFIDVENSDIWEGAAEMVFKRPEQFDLD